MGSMSSPPNDHRREAQEHLDEMTCMLYLERQLERARALEVSAHTQGCNSCRTLLRAMERESRLLTRAMLEEEEPLPARVAAFQERVHRSMQWVWMWVCGLPATAVYAMYTGYIEPWEQRLEQAGFGGTSLLSLLIFQGSFWKGWQSMISLVEILALVTLGGFAVIVARKRFRRGSALALVLTGFCAAFATPAPAAATEVRKGQTAEVRKDENIKGNVYLSGERVEVEGTVDGDVYAAGKDIEIDGHVTGDLISAGRTVWIRGQVDGNVRSAGNTVNVVGKVGKNITYFGDTIRIDEKGAVGGSITMFGSDMNIEGRLGRDLLFMGDRVIVNGTVGGAIDEKGANLEIGSKAQLDGRGRFEGENEPAVSSGAKLASPVRFTKHVHKKEEFGQTSAFWAFALAAAFVVYGMMLFLLMPGFAKEATRSAENIGASLGLGLLVFFGVLIGSVLAMITMIGLFAGL